MQFAKLTQYQIESAASALEDCNRYLKKEFCRYSEANRSPLVDWHIAHASSLSALLLINGFYQAKA